MVLFGLKSDRRPYWQVYRLTDLGWSDKRFGVLDAGKEMKLWLAIVMIMIETIIIMIPMRVIINRNYNNNILITRALRIIILT